MAEDSSSEFDKNISSSKDDDGTTKIIPLSGLYENWFLDYASYVILERAVPALEDGFKPVQRRIMHSMKDLDDGRYNKVANIIGHTMKYHPHGDVSIGDALVQMGQKDLLVDTQGNWGNTLTGDGAAASRYIEARLSKFALEVAFNAKTTRWGLSYDGRNKEPVFLPVKFPLLLAQGAEGIAVGLACKILPHNFNELIDGSIAVLRGKKTNILPDFPNGGMADFSQYNDGLRGGRIRLRAKIRQLDTKTLVVDEIPHGTTTSSLIESIVKANEKGKIKIRKIEDNTAAQAEIIIHLPAGTSPDKTIDALYAFTDCEISISPNSCVIENDKPRFTGVNEILAICTRQTLGLLKLELQIRKNELLEQWHFASLERIFIEKKIYRDIEEATTWSEVLIFIEKGLEPHTQFLKRPVTEEDIVKLTEIKIKRISKFDSFKAEEHLLAIEEELAQVQHHLNNITEFAIDYYKNLKKKYGAGRERKTEIKIFDTIVATKVVVANKKLYVDRAEGFIGYGMKKDEYLSDCSDLDDVIVFHESGTMVVTKVDHKKFVGKNIIHAAVWKKGDKRTVYNMIYQDGTTGPAMMKRFAVTSITRDKEYDLTAGTKGSRILYFSANPNGEAETVLIKLRPRHNLKKQKLELDFADLVIKGRAAKGNILTKNLVSKIELKEKGTSTLAPRKIWFDDVVQRLNADGRGTLLGSFKGSDKILTVYQGGYYRLTGFELSTRFDEDLVLIRKFDPERPLSVVYWDGEKQDFKVKRFLAEESKKPVRFINEHDQTHLEIVSAALNPQITISFDKRAKDVEDESISLADFIAVKGLNAIGNRLTMNKVKNIDLHEEDEEIPEVLDEPDEPEAPQRSEEAEGTDSLDPDIDMRASDTGEAEVRDNDESESTELNAGEPRTKSPAKSRKSPVRPIDDDEDNSAQGTLF